MKVGGRLLPGRRVMETQGRALVETQRTQPPRTGALPRIPCRALWLRAPPGPRRLFSWGFPRNPPNPPRGPLHLGAHLGVLARFVVAGREQYHPQRSSCLPRGAGGRPASCRCPPGPAWFARTSDSGCRPNSMPLSGAIGMPGPVHATRLGRGGAGRRKGAITAGATGRVTPAIGFPLFRFDDLHVEARGKLLPGRAPVRGPTLLLSRVLGPPVRRRQGQDWLFRRRVLGE